MPAKQAFSNLHHYFDCHVCLSIRPSILRYYVGHKIWNHPLTSGVDPLAPGHAATPEELEYAREAGIF